GKRTPRGVAHLRYACVVCTLTSASRCTPGRDEHQLVRGAAGGPAHRASRCAGCSHPGRVLLQGDDARGASLSRPMAACGLDVPGKRTPRGVAHLRYACVVCALTSASRCSPGRDEHQLVRGAAGGPAHGASRCAGCSHPGGCSYKIATPGGKPVASGRGVWARRSRKAYSPGVAHPRYACVVCPLAPASRCTPGGTSTSSSAGQQEDPPMEPAGALAVRTRGGCSYKIATPGGKPVASGRGMWARRSRKVLPGV